MNVDRYSVFVSLSRLRTSARRLRSRLQRNLKPLRLRQLWARRSSKRQWSSKGKRKRERRCVGVKLLPNYFIKLGGGYGDYKKRDGP